MADWKQYALSVAAVSLGCGILTQLLSDSVGKDLLRVVCGVVLSLIVLQPFSRIRIDDLLQMPGYSPESAEQYLRIGEETANEARNQYIKDACEAYIFNKAKAIGAEISVEISLNEDCFPEFAEILGTVDREAQEELKRILATDLGITKENQRWTGNPENRGS